MHYYFKNKECISCPVGFFGNSTAQTCQNCATYCLECTGPAKAHCVTCDNLHSFKSTITSECVLCESNQFGDDVTAHACVNCHSSCKTCSGAADTQCLSCDASKAYFVVISAISKKCIACAARQYGEDATQQCKNCIANCVTCSDGSTCLTCDATTSYLHKTTKVCVACAAGQYGDSTAQACQSCHPNCKVCFSFEEFACTQCDNTKGYVGLGGGAIRGDYKGGP